MHSLILLLALGVGETSNHQDELLPFGNAYEEFRKEGCVSITRKKLSPVTQYKADTDTIIISGQVVQITCKRPESGATEVITAVSVEVSWNRPEFRENGDVLTIEELGPYELYLDGEMHTALNSPFQIDLMPGSYTVAMLAVDTDGLKSDMTNAVSFQVLDEQ